jgi:hypothetical protein
VERLLGEICGEKIKQLIEFTGDGGREGFVKRGVVVDLGKSSPSDAIPMTGLLVVS